AWAALTIGIGAKRRRIGALRFRWPLRLYAACGLIFAQAFERSLTHHARFGPAGKFDLGNQLRLDPTHVLLGGRRPITAKGAGPGGRGLETRQQRRDDALAESGPDAPDIHQVIAAIDPNQQRSRQSVPRGIAADDHFVSRTTFGLGPGTGAPRDVRRIQAL